MTAATNPDYHWTPAQQRAFVDAFADTGSIARACDAVGKSRRAAYNLRKRQDGAAFRIGWDAAILVARAVLSDIILEYAIEGVVDRTIRDPETHTTTRERFDGRLAMSKLSRLDRMAETDLRSGTEGALARIVSQDFEAFLDLIERGGTGAEAALFVAARTPPDPRARNPNGWCEFPDVSDLFTLADDPKDPVEAAADMGVWLHDEPDDWRTDFPPPPDFEGMQIGRFGDSDYERSLSDAERAVQDRTQAVERTVLESAAVAARDLHFGFSPASCETGAAPDDPVPADAETARRSDGGGQTEYKAACASGGRAAARPGNRSGRRTGARDVMQQLTETNGS
jgi:hypothetical protein